MRKAIILPAMFLVACSNYPASLPSIKPYSMDIQQGNVVTSKMLMQLRPGMTKAQVRFVMGSPLIADSFHANRWDYLYRLQKGGKVVEQRRVILDFEDEKLAHVRGDVVAAGSSATAPQPGDTSGSKEPITLKPANGTATKKEDKGLLDKLKFWGGDEKAPAKPQQPATDEKLEALPPLLEGAAPKPAAPVEAVNPEPKPAPVQKPQEKGLLDKLKFWSDDEPKVAPKPVQAPAANQLPDIANEKSEPLPPLMETPAVEAPPAPVKPEAKPAAQRAPAAAPKAEPKPVAKSTPKPEPKPAPKPQEDLPAEGDPGYFERMLEKIGF